MNRHPVMETAGALVTIPPGATLGILGGGQLGRMTALAAACLGYKTHVFTPEADSPCAQVAAAATVAAYDDQEALARFAAQVDVVTLEWENIPVDSLAFLATLAPVHPGASVLAVAQDRTAEKAFANRLGVATAPWRAVRSPEEVAAARAELGAPCVLKTARMGYDGKGQTTLQADTDPAQAWAAVAGKAVGGLAILEGFVPFEREISVIVARRADGVSATFPVAENIHRHHILDRTRIPAAIAPAVAGQATAIAGRLAEALGVVGLLTVEMFVTPQETILVNELAPRPHNSGHWTLDACATSQFAQLVRAVCGLPLGSVACSAAPVEMENLIGDAVERWPVLLADPDARVHLYGKQEARPGRKMGHVTWIRQSSSLVSESD